jgi:hypothetical protein
MGSNSHQHGESKLQSLVILIVESELQFSANGLDPLRRERNNSRMGILKDGLGGNVKCEAIHGGINWPAANRDNSSG